MSSHFGSGYSRANLGKPWVLRRANKLPIFQISNPSLSPIPDSKQNEYCGPCCDTTQTSLHKAKAIVLQCMDFKLRDNTMCHLNLLGYKNEYDECICAGCSLGYNELLPYSGWSRFIDEHILLAYKLHNINEIKIIDHMKCDAYKSYYGPMTDIQEYKFHYKNLKKCADRLWFKFNPTNGAVLKIPGLKIMTYILAIDASKMENIYNKSE